MKRIGEITTKYPFFGSRKIRDLIRREGYTINRKRVQRLMNLMGLESIAPKKRLSHPGKGHKIYPCLLRGLQITRPNQVWCSDITFIRLRGGFAYLTVVMDWHSRYVLSWEISVTLTEDFCVSVLERALRTHPCQAPEIFNTDQGSQYTGLSFTPILKEHGIKISMDGKGRAMDNIVVERLWRTVKYEEIYLRDYENVKDLKQHLKTYFDFYNFLRPHQTFGGKTPSEICLGEFRQKKAA
jgi:putative transposase